MYVGSTENELMEGSVHICKYIHILDLVSWFECGVIIML